MKSSITPLISELLKSYSISIDNKELDFQLRSHPTYPSLHSLTGVLDHFNISNFAIEIPPSEDNIHHLPESFVTQATLDGTSWVFVQKKLDKLNIITERGVTSKVNISEFLNYWSGTCLIIDDELDSKIIAKKSKVKAPLFYVITFISLFLALFIQGNYTLFSITFLTLSLTGVFISLLISQKEIGIKNNTVKKLCTTKNNSDSCEEILNSKSSKIFNTKLSDLSLVYFLGLTVCSVLLSFSGENYTLLKPVVYISILPVIYSFYYQFRILKKICTLCLLIDGVLLLQFGTLFLIRGDQYQWNDVFTMIFGSSLAISFWAFIKDKLTAEDRLIEEKIAHLKFKNNYSLFKTVFQKSSKIETFIPSFDELTLLKSKKERLLEVVLITNPLCGHCSRAVNLAEKLIELNHPNINLIQRFSTSIDKSKTDTQITLQLLEIYHQKGLDGYISALHECHGVIKPQEWLDKYYITDNTTECFNQLYASKEWCGKNGLHFTPTILINGRQFPLEYDAQDLLLFIDDLIEDAQASITITA